MMPQSLISGSGLNKIIPTGSTVKFGDIPGGNYSEFEDDGTLHFVGNATVWKDENFDPIIGRGASAPDLIDLDGTDIQIAAFDGGPTAEEVSSHREMQHDYKNGTNIGFHVHWMPVNANAGNVKWFFDYYIKAGTTIKATGTISVVVAAPGVAWEELRTDTATIDGSALAIGDQVSLRFSRDPTDPQDTYASDAAVTTFGFHYELDTVGSRQIASK